jgi:glycosyltransferase involved in cell wall biosynthesis
MVAFHFPPQAGSSGLLRSLKFSRYLLDYGWRTTVLTAHPRAYERVATFQLDEIPDQVEVMRAFALDSRRHLGVRGRYVAASALPDRWASWCLGAIPRGLLAIYRKRIDVILTTFPIATAILIGFVLHRLTGKPWIVDFRDPLTEDSYPVDPTVRRIHSWIERKAVTHAARLIFTTRSARQAYLDRYPSLSTNRCLLIANGFDEEDFSDLRPANRQMDPDRPLRLLHGGEIYSQERDPRPFFRALGRLKREGRIAASSLQLDLRGSGNEAEYANIIHELAIDDIVHLLPALPYRQLLQDGADSDAMLLFQAANCNHQIPAKVYECLRLGKPILALTDRAGDTAALLNETGGATILDIANEDAIYSGLPAFLEVLRKERHSAPDPQLVFRCSRKQQAYELASALGTVVHGA